MSSKLAKDQDSTSYQALLDKNRALLEENHSLQNEANSLKDEVQSLKARLEEAEELKRAISEGDLDTLVIPGPERELIFTLESADRAYRVLVETMNEGTVTLACDGTILYSNRRFAELMRMPSQAIVGTSIYRFIAPENAITFKALLKQEKGKGEISFQAEGGKLLPVYLSISSLKAEESPNAWCLVVTDLTEQKKNEEILAAERLARSIIEQAAEAIVVCDNSGKIIRFSNSMLKLCGYNPIFQKFEHLIDVRFSEGANAGESIRPVSSALKGSTLLGEEATFELKDCCQKFHLLLNSGPLKNDNGDIIGCVVTLTDITERKQAEKALQESEQRFRLALRNAPISVAAQDRDLRYVWAYNQRTARPEDIIGRFDDEIFTPEEAAHITAIKRRVLNEGVEFRKQMWLNRPSGRIFLDIIWEPIHDATGRVTGVASATVDLTRIKLAEEALREAYEKLQIQSEELQAANEELQTQSEELQEAYEALSESEKQYRLLFDQNMDAIILTDPRGNGKILSANPAACRMLDWSEEELIGKGRDIMFDLEDQTLSNLLEERTCSGSARVQLTYRRKDGTKFIGELSTTLFTDSNGEPRAVAIIRDVTERKQAEEAVKESEERYRMLFTNMTEGFVLAETICNKDGKPYDYRYLELNPAFELNIGIKKEQMLDKSVLEIFPDPNSIEIEKLGEVALSGKSTHFEVFSQAVNKHFDIYAFSPEKGKIAAIFRDITERKRAEEALKESEERYRTFFENSIDAVLLTSPDGSIFAANPAACQIFGMTEEEIIRAGRDGVIDTSDPRLKPALEERARTGKFKGELNYRRKEGTIFPGEVSTSLFVDRDGLVKTAMIIRDITERKQAEAKLKEILDNLDKLVKERTAELESAYNLIKESERGLSEAQKMANLGNWDWDILTDEIHGSEEAYRIFGISPQEKGITYDTFLNYIRPEDRGYVDNAVKEALKGKPFDIEYRIVSVSEEERIIHAQNEVLFNEENIPVGMRGTIQDITERKQAEEALTKIDKLRIKEIHHRIKNNLQVISSLLDLQAETFSHLEETCNTSEVVEAFKESQNRVISMAIIHEELYKGDKIDTLDFAAYLRKLTADLFSSYNIGNKNISFNLSLEQVNLDMDTAIPLGIIVNELVSNSFKHAFPAGSEGEVEINLRKTENSDFLSDISDPGKDCMEKSGFDYIIKVSDNGKGFPEEIDFQNTDSLGLQLINILVEQIDGSIELKRGQGTEFVIWFNNIEG